MGEKYTHVPVVDGSTILPAWGDGVTKALERIDALSIDYELLLDAVPFAVNAGQSAKAWCTDASHIYVLQGQTAFYRRNVSTGAWSLLANFPIAITSPLYVAICRLGTNIYALYGAYQNQTLYVYSITSNTWSTKTLPVIYGANTDRLSIISDGTRYVYIYAEYGTQHRFDSVGNSFTAIPLAAGFFSPEDEPTFYTGPVDGRLVNVWHNNTLGENRVRTRAANGDGSDIVERGVIIGGHGDTACLVSPSEILIANKTANTYSFMLSLVDVVDATVKQFASPRMLYALILAPDHYVYGFNGYVIIRFKLGRQWQSWMR